MQLKKRLIDANELKKKKTILWDEALGFCECVLIDDIDDAPTVQAVEVVRGRNLKEDWPSLFECSECGCDSIDTYSFEPSTINYCPNCGADMRGSEE